MVKIPKFEGKAVVGVKLALTGLGDGLSKAVGLDPVVLHPGQEVDIVVRGVVAQVNHKTTEAPDMLVREHKVKGQVLRLVLPDTMSDPAEAEVVSRILNDQIVRIDNAAAEADEDE